MTLQEENQGLIQQFQGCRVTEVREGMACMGYHHYGMMDRRIRPLFPVQMVGIARTARYLPYEGPAPSGTGEAYAHWLDSYYREVCTEPWMQDIEPGDCMVFDISGVDAGLLTGSSALSARLRGAVGFVINGCGVRDTDEVIMQEVPAWCMDTSRSTDQARLRYTEKDVPVAMGGVAVYPGDVIVADYEGVIVVPRAIAAEVAQYARTALPHAAIAPSRLRDLERVQFEIAAENMF